MNLQVFGVVIGLAGLALASSSKAATTTVTTEDPNPRGAVVRLCPGGKGTYTTDISTCPVQDDFPVDEDAEEEEENEDSSVDETPEVPVHTIGSSTRGFVVGWAPRGITLSDPPDETGVPTSSTSIWSIGDVPSSSSSGQSGASGGGATGSVTQAVTSVRLS